MLKHQLFSLSDVPFGLLLFVGLPSLFYRELSKLGICKGKYRHCAIRLNIFGVSTLIAARNEARSIYFSDFGERAWFTSLARSRRPSTVLVALEYLDLHQKSSIF